jgi:hypothetical protein
MRNLTNTDTAKSPAPNTTKASGKTGQTAAKATTSEVTKETTKPTDSDLRAQLLGAYRPTTAGLLDKIKAEASFGKEWARVKVKIKADKGTTVQSWVANNSLPFSHQYANGCDRLAQAYSLVQPAHDWYHQFGFADGYRVKKNSGWEYALEVIALHAKYKRGESAASATAGKAPPTETSRDKIEKLTKALSDREQEVSILIDALDRVATLYRQTAEGANYTDATLKTFRVVRQKQVEVTEQGSTTNVSYNASLPLSAGNEVANQPLMDAAFKEAA